MMELEGVEGRETENVEVGLMRELEGCRNKCKELEGRSTIAEERCTVLESEIEKRESEFTVLAVEKIEIEDEVKVLKRRNAELEKRISEVENGSKVDGDVVVMTEEKDEEEEVFQLMIENKVLECEKKRAESEVEVWKLKCGKLELRVLELEKENLVLRGKQSPLAGMMKTQLTNKASDPYNGSDVVTISEHLVTENQKMADNNEMLLNPSRTSSTCSPLKGIGDLQAAVTPLIDQPSNQSTQVEGRKKGFLSETEMDCGSHVRKQLVFGEEGSLSKKIAPLTPRDARPLTFGIIDISDSEDELGDTVGNEAQKTCDVNLKKTLFYQSDEEDMNGYKRNAPFVSTPKRKRASNIVTTDSESDDDNVLICKFKTKRLHELNQGAMHSYLKGCSVTSAVSEEKVRESATPRRRLVALRDCKVKEGPPEQNSPGNSYNNGANYHFGIPTNKDVENDEMEDDGSASDIEGESLGGFIVSSSDDSDGDDGSIASEDVSDGNVDYGEVISRIRRNGNHKLKWEFEADMLAAFGKDPELCMKAVCALYRQQTSEEKYSKGTIYTNQRGFSQCDAFRGTTLAEFLTDGDPKGDVIKSVEELQVFDPKGPELCRTLATHYSKQLFAIYKNKEDPFFLP